MQVSYDENKVNEDIIVSEVEKAGYGAALANAGNEKRTGKGKRINTVSYTHLQVLMHP